MFIDVETGESAFLVVVVLIIGCIITLTLSGPWINGLRVETMNSFLCRLYITCVGRGGILLLLLNMSAISRDLRKSPEYFSIGSRVAEQGPSGSSHNEFRVIYSLPWVCEIPASNSVGQCSQKCNSVTVFDKRPNDVWLHFDIWQY